MHDAQVLPNWRGCVPATVQPIFPQGHALSRLVRPSFSSIREALSHFDVSLIWNCTKYDPKRAGVRDSFAYRYGVGSELGMPLSVAYLGCPGKSRVFVPGSYRRGADYFPGADRTAVDYLVGAGFIGKRDVVYVRDLNQMRLLLLQSGRKVYSVDELPPFFDEVSANGHLAMQICNSKEWVSRLSACAVPETLKKVDDLTVEDYRRYARTGRPVWVKTCNTENSGSGVYPVRSEDEFLALCKTIGDNVRKHGLNPEVSVQPHLEGKNKSFQVFLDPTHPDQVQVVALSDQLTDANGGFLGNVNHPIDAQGLEQVGPVILDMIDRMRALKLDPVGFVMCDYFETPEGKLVTIDPGLRPTGNTAAAIVRMWVEEMSGQTASVKSFVRFDYHEPGLQYAEVVERLGDYADPDKILATRYGVLPWGHNHIAGNSLFLVITPTPADYDAFHAELRRRLFVV